ncbi:MAG TPA: hypothetical protein VMV03_08045 [Spirochaetia bacterium]|nr:hypothetical protein [Spirochaetia bacterium]
MLGRNVSGPSPLPGPEAGGIRISPRPGLRLHAGDTVLLTVIKELAPGKWAVGIGGKVYPAWSRLLLEPGAVLQARVAAGAGKLILSISDQRIDSVAAALRREGLPAGSITETIARALASSGLPITADTIERVKAVLARTRFSARRGARLVAGLIDKKIDPSSPGAADLMAVLALGERGGSDPRRYRGRPFPESGAALRKAVNDMAAAGAVRPDALQVFNHARAGAQNWVIIPFVFGDPEDSIAGTIRILHDPFRGRLLRLVLVAGSFSFFLPLDGRSRKLSIYCDDEHLRMSAQRGLDSARAKFHNMGIEVDDTIHGGDDFDGFAPAGEGSDLPSIDVAG